MFLRAIALSLALAGLSGCTTAQYLAQAGCGQIDIMLRARDLEATVADTTVPQRTRDLLSQVAEIKKYGEQNSLRPTGSYHRYVELDRPVVVWVVTASDPLRFHSKTWWFPIVGRVPYLGWFDRDAAREFAASLEAEGYDVDIGGAGAYSTLGWFDDPVLSTMLGDGDRAIGELAEVVLHESVHATLYVDGQTRFNESLAEFVSARLARTYLDQRYGSTSKEKKAYAGGENRGGERRARMHRAYEELSALYASNKSKSEKLAEKARIIATLRREAKIRRPVNNATLASFKNYHSGKPDFESLLNACGGSWSRFLGTLAVLKEEKKRFKSANQQDLEPVLKPLTLAGCPVKG
ncbi:Putative zinc protease protein [Minicystis rosea]|nr:Putative zinc protease protein [Minicystis rosea]